MVELSLSFCMVCAKVKRSVGGLTSGGVDTAQLGSLRGGAMHVSLITL